MLQIMKNETEDFMALAKAYAQAERALRIERWVIVTFELRKTDGPIEILYRYDLPRTMLERYRWVVRWRTARFQCRFPRDTIILSEISDNKIASLSECLAAITSSCSATSTKNLRFVQ